MQIRNPLFILISLTVLAAGCAKPSNQITIPKDAAQMEVDFSGEAVKPCTHESPEIRVSAIPEGTKDLRVKLKNISVPAWNQGGGMVTHDGSGVIPAGALGVGYNGPCPPPGQRYKFEWWVMAVDAQGRIIGFGKTREPYPPKK
jgi:hypothetical protein